MWYPLRMLSPLIAAMKPVIASVFQVCKLHWNASVGINIVKMLGLYAGYPVSGDMEMDDTVRGRRLDCTRPCSRKNSDISLWFH